MGAALKITGQQILAQTPIKRDYAFADIKRTARLYETDFSMPSYFPSCLWPCAAHFMP